MLRSDCNNNVCKHNVKFFCHFPYNAYKNGQVYINKDFVSVACDCYISPFNKPPPTESLLPELLERIIINAHDGLDV